jgi:hypothetical protein
MAARASPIALTAAADAEALNVKFPDKKPCRYAYVLRITTNS